MVHQWVPVLEIGGTHVTAAIVDTDAWTVVAGTTARTALDAGGTAEEIVATVAHAAASLLPDDGLPWGVALPGPFDYARGVALYAGVDKFDALRGVDLGARLREALALQPGSIHFVNDAEAFAVGEWVAGAAKGHRRMIGVTLGTGIGSAFLADGGRHDHGPGVPPEGRLDLLEVAGRPLEDTVSRRAIRALYATLTGPPVEENLDVREIAARTSLGDSFARRAIDEPLQTLGRVLAPRAMEFTASIVVIGGSIAYAWDVIEPPLRSGMTEASPGWSGSFAVAPAHCIEDAALVGAAWHAIHAGTTDTEGQ
jgi:glucokinase